MGDFSEIPDSLFMIRWSEGAKTDQVRADYFELHSEEWHWLSRESESSQLQHVKSAHSLEQISRAFGSYFGEGVADKADFFCAPRIGDDPLDENETSIEIFPLDVILEEIAHVFSRTTVSALEYGNGRKWFIWRSSYYRPNSIGEVDAPGAHHLFWFPEDVIVARPEFLYFNVRPPRLGELASRWSAWELALKAGHLILHSYWDVDVATGATASILDTSVEGMTPLEFLWTSSPSWKVRPDGSLSDNWGHLVMASPDKWDSLGLEFLPEKNE